MAAHDHPHDTAGTSTTSVAIVAIAVILLLAVIAFFVFLQPGNDIAQQPAEPDIEFEIEPPAQSPETPGPGGGDAGAEDANGELITPGRT